MKRTAILLLVMSLLLTACSGITAPKTTDAPTVTEPSILVPTQPTMESVTTSTAEPTSELPTVPTAPAPPETEPPAPETTEPEPTPTTWKVYTDWSAYEPYAGSGAKYTRLHSGDLDHFEPSEDYGLVFPYRAAAQILDEYCWETQYTYGLADRNGRILTDGIYYGADLIIVGDPEPRSYWRVSRMIDRETFRERFPDLEYGEWEAELPLVYGLISLDGRVVMDCAYPRLYPVGDTILRENGGGRFDFTILNADLEPLCTGEDIFGSVECDEWDLDYADGFFLASTVDSHQDSSYNDVYENWAAWFCDETGTRVLGPYAYASNFSEGLAFVSPDGEHCGYIDKNGDWVIPPVYRCEAPEWFPYWHENETQNGIVILRAEDEAVVVLDRNGREVFRQKQGAVSYRADYADCGFVLYARVEVGGYSFEYPDYYDPEGYRLVSGGQCLRCVGERTFLDYDEETGLARFFTPEGTLLSFEADQDLLAHWNYSDFLEKGVCKRGSELLLGWYLDPYAEGGTMLFLTEDFSEVIEVPPPTSPAPESSYSLRYTRHCWDLITLEPWYFCWTGTGWEGRTESGGRAKIPLRAWDFDVMGDVICAYTDSATYLLSRGGEPLFCYPFDAGD